MSEKKRTVRVAAKPAKTAAKATCVLDLRTIEQCSSLTPSILASLREAAEVVLDRRHPREKNSVAAEVVRNGLPQAAQLLWEKATQQMRHTHANDNNASEDGAIAVAIVTVFRALGFKVVRRSPHGSGADYLMRRSGAPSDEFIRLEVSGIIGVAKPNSRLKQKVLELQA